MRPMDQDIVASNRSWHRLMSGVALVFIIIVTLSVMLRSQAPPSYKPTEVQSLRLQVKQRDAWLAQRDAIEAQRRYQQAIAELNAEGENVRKENGWPETVIFNPDRVEYSEPPKDTGRPSAPGVAPSNVPTVVTPKGAKQ